MAINWLQRARSENTPFIEGEKATFYWHGGTPPLLIGDFCDWENAPVEMQRAGKHNWIYTLDLPADAYIEYAYLDGEERLIDPFNPRRTSNGMGKYNHFFYMPKGQPTPLIQKRKRVGFSAGTISHHYVPCEGLLAGKQRLVHLFQPAAPGPYPLLVVWDGKEYLRRARLPQMVDALISLERIQPITIALVENGGKARWMEYQSSEISLIFLLSEVLPLAMSQLDLLKPEQSPGAYGIMGASMGGLMAMYTGMRVPQIFGRILSQSGAFIVREGWEELTMELARMSSPKGQKIWMDVGLYDMPSLLKGNRFMRTLLHDRGFEVGYREYPAGHNYPAWRDDVWRGLEYIFPAKARKE